MKLSEKKLLEYLLDVESSAPAPGGGSVAAYTGSLGAALTTMVAALTIPKKIFEDIPADAQVRMKEDAQKLLEAREELFKIVDEDASAFDDCMNAFKLPKNTDEEKEIRSKAIQEGYKKALEVPFKCARLCLRILELQDIFAEYGNLAAITDVGMGTLLAYASLEGALFNVTINVKSLKDEEYRNEVKKEVEELLQQGNVLKDARLNKVYARLNA